MLLTNCSRMAAVVVLVNPKHTHTGVNDIGSGESTGCQPFVVDDDADK